MTPILLVEIISALVGLVCLGALTVRFICVRLNRTQGNGAGRECGRAALACFVLCAMSMTRFAHLNASESRRAHLGLFITSVIFFVGHVVAARL